MSESTRVVDVLALASSETNSTIGSLGESLSKVAATARQLKIPLEDTVAAVALLQDVGLDASTAGTAMNTMLTKMAAPTAAMKKKMDALGVSFKDSRGNMLSFEKVIEQLNTATKRTGGNFDQVAFLAEMVGLRGQKAAANLAHLFETGRIKELTVALKNAAGSAEEIAKLRMDTLTGDITLMKSAIDGVKISIFDLNQGPLRDVVQGFTDWIKANKKLIVSKVQDFIVRITKAVRFLIKHRKAILITIGAVVAFIAVLKTLIGVMTLINLITAANPITLMVLGIVGALALFTLGIITLVKNWNELVEAIKWFGKLALDHMIGKWIEKFEKLIWVFKKVKSVLTGVPMERTRDQVIDDLLVQTPDGRWIRRDQESNASTAQMISPSDRLASSLQESRTTNTSEVTIRDETGRAEVTSGILGTGLQLIPSGVL
jgi:hypothetical protein